MLNNINKKIIKKVRTENKTTKDNKQKKKS